MKNLYGQLDLTMLGRIVRQHKELVKTIMFKDGEHQLINIDIFAKKEVDKFDNVATIKASCKKDEQRDGVNYYVANLKESKYQDQNQSQQAQAAPQSQQTDADKNDGLPF